MEENNFYERYKSMIGEPGNMVIFLGEVWYCVILNKSNRDCNAVLIQYLPKLAKLFKFTQQALPKNLDNAHVGNMEGCQ